jgi:hypothetical protein
LQSLLAGDSPAGRYELVPEPDLGQSPSNRVASAYVIDKKADQFWVRISVFPVFPWSGLLSYQRRGSILRHPPRRGVRADKFAVRMQKSFPLAEHRRVVGR